jgi:hypothetical protein
MIRNIKIHNILDIIDVSKSMEPNKCIQIFFNEMFIWVFPMIFKVW